MATKLAKKAAPKKTAAPKPRNLSRVAATVAPTSDSSMATVDPVVTSPGAPLTEPSVPPVVGSQLPRRAWVIVPGLPANYPEQLAEFEDDYANGRWLDDTYGPGNWYFTD